MRKTGFIVLAFLLFTSLAIAQVPNRVNVFFGYSYSSVNTFGFADGDRINLATGWEGSLEGRVLPFVGVVADFDSHSGSPSLFVACPKSANPTCSPSTVNIHQADFLFGPRLSVPIGRFRPFAEALFGFEHVTTNGFGPDKSFASAFGGGLDYKLMRRVAVRVEGDYMRTQLFSATQKNMRLSTGLVLRF